MDKFLDEFEEVWVDDNINNYIIIKYNYSDDNQDGNRFYLADQFDKSIIVRNFDTMRSSKFGGCDIDNFEKLSLFDIYKLLNGEYVISNGTIWGCKSFKYITYKELVNKGIFNKDDIYDFKK